MILCFDLPNCVNAVANGCAEEDRYYRRFGRARSFDVGILSWKCLLDIQTERNQEGRQMGTSELSRAVRAEDIHWESILMNCL